MHRCHFMVHSNIRDIDLPPQRLLRRKEAARYLQQTYGIPISMQTMAKLAVVGGGPLFFKAGRFPLYAIVDLDAWARLKLGPKRRSTSDYHSPLSDEPARPHNAKCHAPESHEPPFATMTSSPRHLP
jgi:hypothetical protein